MVLFVYMYSHVSTVVVGMVVQLGAGARGAGERALQPYTSARPRPRLLDQPVGLSIQSYVINNNIQYRTAIEKM